MDPDRQAALLSVKLRALVAGQWGDGASAGRAGSFPGGATLAAAGSVGWVLLGGDAARRLGAGLAWGRQAGLTELHLLVDEADAAGVLARRAAYFRVAPAIWVIKGRDLTPAAAAPLPDPAVPPPQAELFRLMLIGAGVEAVVEGGEVLGEVNGLEVARVTDANGGGARLGVGIGRFDREAFAMMNPDLPDADALAKAAAVVRQHRRGDAPRHPLNQLVPERWLRSLLVQRPSLVGAARLTPVESALPRRNLRETAPASAVGTDAAGRPMVVTCSVGVDLELVPTAADDRARHDPQAQLVLALPERDAVALTRTLAAALTDPAEVRTVTDNWK